ncbi:MAG: TolC family protein [Bacteroidota bacterium]
MIRKSKFFIAIFLLLFSVSSFAQTENKRLLSLETFLKLVKQHHPMAKQADNIVESAEANKLLSRGGFDPKLFYDFKNKTFDGKNYYALGDGGFSIPTWFGLEFKGGFEQNQGVFLSPENITPASGLLYSKISVSVLQGLVIDERRAVLKQAKIFRELSDFDKINALNELLYKAGKTYWDWYLSYANLRVLQNAVELSQIRFDAVRSTFRLGDRPAIDTVEATIQLQDRIINYQQGMVDYRTKSLLLSNFLWVDENTPVEITDNVIPDIAASVQDEWFVFFQRVEKIDSIINQHPALKMYEYKLRQLKIEEKFKREKLKPNLNLEFNPLFAADNLNPTLSNNYKWGVSFAFPLLLRKERGDLKLTKIKIQNTLYDNSIKRLELLNKTKAGINEYNNFRLLVDMYTKNVSNYETLWLSEKRLFDNGESSLFMINSREMSYINAQIKHIEIINKNKKAALETTYAFGTLNTLF